MTDINKLIDKATELITTHRNATEGERSKALLEARDNYVNCIQARMVANMRLRRIWFVCKHEHELPDGELTDDERAELDAEWYEAEIAKADASIAESQAYNDFVNACRDFYGMVSSMMVNEAVEEARQKCIRENREEVMCDVCRR